MIEREQLLRGIEKAAEHLEECAVLLAEVHLRFGKPKIQESDFTFGDAARMYNRKANELRELLAPRPAPLL